MNKAEPGTWIARLFALGMILTISALAQTYTELLSFNGNSAAGPQTSLVQGIDGSLYGTTYYGGTGTCFDNEGIGCGVVFKLTRKGTLQIVYNFQSSSPSIHPGNDFIVADDGSLYGEVQNTMVKITPNGLLTTLHTFGGSAGSDPTGHLVQSPDGNFYGTTYLGGAPSNFCPNGCGTIFKMTPSGAVTTLYSFCPQNYCPDGENPVGALVQGSNGNFYGTTQKGGLYKNGTFFKVSPNGAFTLLYTFEGFNAPPYPGGVILADDGNFYGTDAGQFVYRITPGGVFTNLSSLNGNLNPVVQGTDGNLYGATQSGGSFNNGFIFQMSTGGTTSALYNFVGYPDDGAKSFSSLVQATDGKFYGTTYAGGDAPCNFYNVPGCGTVFSLDMGLQPFVAFLGGAAKVGRKFGILGQELTGTTSVSLNGTPASFTIKSDTLLIATVPAGATTGRVTVTTPTGTLNSNVSFYVIP